MSLVCRICLSGGSHTRHRAREHMLGWGGEFDYFCCAECGCLQIVRVPEDLSRYYPPTYYSYHSRPVPQRGLKSWLAGKRDLWAATGTGVMGGLVNKVIGARIEVLSLGGVPVRKGTRILDVGCGRGQLLSILHRAGVGRVEGIDPYLPEDVEVVPGLWARKLALDELSGEFDLIMLHHTFEHVEFGLELLAAAARRLSAVGKILLRFPTPESAAWERYRENWVQLDAPRHLFLHTRKSLEILGEQAGLRVERCWCDSTGFQFWASELYERGLSLFDDGGNLRDPKDHFTREQLKKFEQMARKMNANQRGDQVAAVLSARHPKSAPA